MEQVTDDDSNKILINNNNEFSIFKWCAHCIVIVIVK